MQIHHCLSNGVANAELRSARIRSGFPLSNFDKLGLIQPVMENAVFSATMARK